MGQPEYYKACQFINKFTNKESGCGTSIGWDNDDRLWREEGNNKIHTKERCKEIRNSKKPQTQPQQQPTQPQQEQSKPLEVKQEERNPIAKAVSEDSGT